MRAFLLFDDPFRLEVYDGREGRGEDRFFTIGLDRELDTLYVCYTIPCDALKSVSANFMNSKVDGDHYGKNSYCGLCRRPEARRILRTKKLSTR